MAAVLVGVDVGLPVVGGVEVEELVAVGVGQLCALRAPLGESHGVESLTPAESRGLLVRERVPVRVDGDEGGGGGGWLGGVLWRRRRRRCSG